MFGIKNFIYALSVFLGTIIGVGFFALPYITTRVGLWTILFYFLFLGLIVIFLQLLFAEVVMRTKDQRRLPGYARLYLGKWGERIASITTVLGLSGAMLAYLIVGGEFLRSLFSPIFGNNILIYTFIYFIAGAILIYFGIKSIAKIEFFAVTLLIVILLIIFGQGFNLIGIENLFNFDPAYIFLPYGVILFSFWGMALIPEIKEMLFKKERELKKIIPLAVFISAMIYLFFIFIVVGITGEGVSKDAISGLRGYLDNWVIGLALLFGILATFTSFITIGLTLKKVFWYDFNLPKNLAWLIACFGPFILFLLGMRDFIMVIGLVGGVMLGIDGIIIILMHFKAKTKGEKLPAWKLSLSRPLAYFLILILILGIISIFLR